MLWKQAALVLCMATLASAPGVANADTIDDLVKTMTRSLQAVNRIKIIGTELSLRHDLVPEEFLQDVNHQTAQLQRERYSEFEGSEDDYAITVHAWVEASVTDELDRAIARATRRIAKERVLWERVDQLEERLEHASESLLVAGKLKAALEEIVSEPGGAVLDALTARKLSFTLLKFDEEVVLKLSARNSELRRVHREAKKRLKALTAHNETVRPLVEILKEERERRQAHGEHYTHTGASGRLSQTTSKDLIARRHAAKGVGQGGTQGDALAQTQITAGRLESPPLPTLIAPIPEGMRAPFPHEDTFHLPPQYKNLFTTPWHDFPQVIPEQSPISIESLQ